MGTSTFSGPLKAGTTREGASKNTGYTVMAQTGAWVQSTTAAAVGDIIIPANSQILEIQLTVTVAPTAGNISMGTSATSTELFTALAAGTAANVFLFGSAATITDGDTWADVGTSDVTIYADCSAGTTGRGFITVSYIQGIDNA
jgi:hypothetical protein